MRVVAGSLGGRPLRAPRGDRVRPTADRVREALFSTLGARVAGAAVLDLFAGSGALGIEAWSRGAATVTFVERDRRVVDVLRDNLRALGLDAPVHVTDALRFVRAIATTPDGPYDLVLCDPPYALSADALAAVLAALADGGLAPGATVVVERDRRSTPPPTVVAGLRREDHRVYGDTVLYYLRWHIHARQGDHEQ